MEDLDDRRYDGSPPAWRRHSAKARTIEILAARTLAKRMTKECKRTSGGGRDRAGPQFMMQYLGRLKRLIQGKSRTG